MSTDNLRMRVQMLEASNARLERERKQYWAVPMVGGGASVINVMWIIQGANVLTSPPTTGIKYTSTNLDASTFPIPTIVPAPAPGSIVNVDASSPPAGMPVGIGTVKAFGNSTRRFALNDNRITGITRDMRAGDKVFGVDEVILSRIVAGVTYNYTCILVEATV